MLLETMWAPHETDDTVSSTILFVSLDDWNKVQHDFFGNVMPVLASHDPNGINNSTITFVHSWLLKWDATWLFHLCDTIATGISILWCQ